MAQIGGDFASSGACDRVRWLGVIRLRKHGCSSSSCVVPDTGDGAVRTAVKVVAFRIHSGRSRISATGFRLPVVPTLLPLIALILLVSPCTYSATRILANQAGLSSFEYDGVDYLRRPPACYVMNVTLQQGDAAVRQASESGALTVRSAVNRVLLERSYSWGTVRCVFSLVGDRVMADVVVSNASPSLIGEVSIQLIALASPSGAITRIGGATNGPGGPDVLFIPYGAVQLYVANEQMTAMRLGLTAPVIPAGIGIYLNSSFDILVGGPQPHARTLRPIPAGSSDSYSLSFRFAPQTASPVLVMGDLFRRWAARFPAMLNWPDRRPIGDIILAAHGPTTPFYPGNPRYWLFVDGKVDINSRQGREQFKERLLADADRSVATLKAENAQGMIVWDIEGEEFPKFQYVGDPRYLPPEMQGAADEYLRRFTRAGLRCGLALSVRKFMNPPDAASSFLLTNQTTRRYIDDPDELFDLLDRRIKYSKQRWGCTLFYVDSNGTGSTPTDYVVFRRLAALNPDVLLIPEVKTLTYYASTAPYCDETLGKEGCPSAEARWLYPKAFSVIKVSDAKMRPYTPMNLVNRVRNGDVLMTDCCPTRSCPNIRILMDIKQRAAMAEMPQIQK
jgi:hypothetical protein